MRIRDWRSDVCSSDLKNHIELAHISRSQQDRVEADRLRGRFGIAYRPHRLAPWAGREPGVKKEDERRQQDDENGDFTLAEDKAEQRWHGDANQSTPSSRQVAPFRRPLLDDEAEGDGDRKSVV